MSGQNKLDLTGFFKRKNEEEGEEVEAQVEKVVWLGGSATIIKLHCIKFSKNPQKCKKSNLIY